VHTAFWCGNLRIKDHLEGLDVDEGIILKCIFKRRNEGMNWFALV
jgi:hypothetical protein